MSIVLVTGSGGLVGSEIVRYARAVRVTVGAWLHQVRHWPGMAAHGSSSR